VKRRASGNNMKQHEPLARATLDTLPMNIAVLDGDGTILFTNQTWQQFSEESSTQESDFTGENYFAGIDQASDTYAAKAVDGIQSVMDGEQTLFTLEYPCETPEGGQWFLMRVVPLFEDGEKVVVAHIDITDRKLAEIRAEERAAELKAERQRLDHLLSRINGLVQETMETLMAADNRESLEQSLCEQFVAADPFVGTWIGDLDLRSERITPTRHAGIEADGVSIRLDDDDPTARAASTRELQVVGDVRDLPDGSAHREISPDAKALAAVPLAANGTLYGVLTAYADERNAFDNRETVVLEALGRGIATAINAIERKRLLTADEIVEVELEIRGRDAFVFDLGAEIDTQLEYAGSVRNEPSDYLVFFTVPSEQAEAVLTAAVDHPDVVAATHVSDFDDVAFVEFEVRDPPVVSALADYGAETRAMTVSGNTATVTAEFAAEADVRSVVDSLGERFRQVELLAYRERERPTRTKQEFASNLTNELTDRQRTAIRKAYVGGFFEWPRDTSGEDLAASMDISPSTYHQHLRAAQRKVFTEIFDQ